MPKRNLTQERLKELLHYDPDSGSFIWRKTVSTRALVGTKANYHDCYGYVVIGIDGLAYKAHRLAFLYMTGRLPINHIDHINHIRDDNRIANLREATFLINARNQPKSKANKTGIVGVHWDNKTNKWFSAIGVNGGKVFLYQGSDFFEACCARKSAEIKFNYHPNHGRKQNGV